MNRAKRKRLPRAVLAFTTRPTDEQLYAAALANVPADSLHRVERRLRRIVAPINNPVKDAPGNSPRAVHK